MANETKQGFYCYLKNKNKKTLAFADPRDISDIYCSHVGKIMIGFLNLLVLMWALQFGHLKPYSLLSKQSYFLSSKIGLCMWYLSVHKNLQEHSCSLLYGLASFLDFKHTYLPFTRVACEKTSKPQQPCNVAVLSSLQPQFG